MSVKNYPIGTHFAGPIKLGASSMRLSTDVGGIAAAKTLTADESNGQTYILDAAAGVVITLPAPTQGWKTKFIVGALFATTNYVLTAETAGQIQGSIMEVSTVELATAADTVTLNAAADAIGDWVEFSSDGTSIFVAGSVATIAGVTIA
tara:strand:+ start:9878 stop:10324 length:447 start_codon:yes stop_codon:yes gene_type:complete